MGLFDNDYVGGGVGRSSTAIKNSYIYPAQQLVKYGLGWEESPRKVNSHFFREGFITDTSWYLSCTPYITF